MRRHFRHERPILAVESYRRALRIRGEVADADTGNAELLASLSSLCGTLATIDPAAAATTARCGSSASPEAP